MRTRAVSRAGANQPHLHSFSPSTKDFGVQVDMDLTPQMSINYSDTAKSSNLGSSQGAITVKTIDQMYNESKVFEQFISPQSDNWEEPSTRKVLSTKQEDGQEDVKHTQIFDPDIIKIQEPMVTLHKETIIKQEPSEYNPDQQHHSINLIYKFDQANKQNRRRLIGAKNKRHFKKKKKLILQSVRYNILTLEQKQEIVEFADTYGKKLASQHFNVAINNISRWGRSCQRKSGAGRKVHDPQMESRLLQWINRHLSFGQILTRKQIRVKALQLSNIAQFKASKGWYQRFMARFRKISTDETDKKKEFIDNSSNIVTRKAHKNYQLIKDEV